MRQEPKKITYFDYLRIKQMLVAPYAITTQNLGHTIAYSQTCVQQGLQEKSHLKNFDRGRTDAKQASESTAAD
jgi:hypothetical protein